MTGGLFNYHTHTTFCDGRDTPERMVETAVALGMETLGFSSHAPTLGDTSYCLRDTAAYRDEIARLKDKYSDRIMILCGIERDIYSDDDGGGYDYVIGAAHYIRHGGSYVVVDYTRDNLLSARDELWGGDGAAMAAEYMEQSSRIAELTGCDIVAHLDLVTKYNECAGGALFDADDPRYVAACRGTVKKLARTGALFEINTGAISRGYRRTPYPSPAILDMIHDAGGHVTYGADCHGADALLCCLEEARRLAAGHGFEEFCRLPADKNREKMQ